MATTGPALSARDQKVTIYLDANGNVLRVDPVTFQVSKSRQEQVVWQTNPPNRPFTVSFDGASPFDEGSFSHVNCRSGMVKSEIEGDDHKPEPERTRYTYKVKAGANPIDPDGVVNR